MPAVFTAAFAVFLLFVMYLLRGYDDNTLVSWRWIFGYVDAYSLFITLSLSAIAAYMMSTLGLPGPRGLFVISLLLGASFLNVPEVMIDSSRYFTQAKHLGQYGFGYFVRQWGGEIEAWTDLPLMPLLYGTGFRYIGEYRIVVQAMVLLMFAGAVTLTSVLGRDMFGRRTGSLAGMFLLSVPYLYSQVPLMMVDVPAMFFLVLAFYSFRRGLLEGGLWALLWAPLSISMAFFTKYSLWPMLSLAVPVLAICQAEDDGAWKRSFLTALVFSLITLPVLWYYREIVASQIDLLVSYQKPGLKKWGESLVSTFLFHVHPYVTLAAVASIPLAIKRRERLLIPLVWLVVLVLVVLDVRRIRYTIPVFPVIALMAAYVISWLKTDRAVRSLACASLTTSFVIALAGYAPFMQTHSLVNLKLAGQYLDASAIDTVTVMAMPQKSVINPAVSVPLLDLYTQARIIYYFRISPAISPEETERSSFRFTWTYRNPDYYESSADVDQPEALVYVTPETVGLQNHELQGMEVAEKYDINEGLFKFNPFVLIYRPVIDK